MLKKIVLGTLCIGFIGILIYGAILRTNAKTSSGDSRGPGLGTGLGRGRGDTVETTDVAYSRGQGQGQRRSQTARDASEQPVDASGLEQNSASQNDRVAEWQTVEGTVISIGTEAMVVELVDGHQILVEGQPWLYVQSQAFSPQIGDQVALKVFEEDDELKPGQIDNLSNGETITLRLEDGQPMWAASLQNDQGSTTGTGQGQGNGQGQGSGGGQGQGNGGRGQGNTGGEQTNSGITAADWLTFEGTAATVNSTELVIEGDTNEPVLVDGRAWTYALEQGVDVQVGNVVRVTGFVEDSEFKTVSLENLTTGQRITVRDTNGRPLWSGGGRGGA